MTLRVVVVYPDLLGTYGDGGNGVVLVKRAQWRGIDAELLDAPSGAPLPAGDCYCLGGGEDGPQHRAAELLRADGALARAREAGIPILAVCAGYQIVGRTFADADGRPLRGLGLLDIATAKEKGRRRAVGEILAEPLEGGLPTLTGFENHGGHTSLGKDATALATVVAGIGNGDGSEGAVAGKLLGTYMHGPVLARNPALADRLLHWATGETLPPIDDEEEEALRAERIAAVRKLRQGFGARRS